MSNLVRYDRDGDEIIMRLFEAKRLVKLRDKMASLREKALFMGTWFDGQDDDIVDKLKNAGVKFKDNLAPSTITEKIVSECGTTCCALGWAGTIPEFRKRGLRLEVNADVSEYEFINDTLDSTVSLYDTGNGELVTDNPFEAGALFFGLHIEESAYLFDPDEYVDLVPTANRCSNNIKPKHVVKHINKVLKDNDYGYLV